MYTIILVIGASNAAPLAIDWPTPKPLFLNKYKRNSSEKCSFRLRFSL